MSRAPPRRPASARATRLGAALAGLALLGLGLLVPSAGSLARTVQGEATYRERIAMPADAVLVVEAHDATGALLAEARLPGAGRQVPLEFGLELPGDTAVHLRAALLVGAQARWSSAPLEVPAGPADLDLGVVVLTAFEPLLFAASWRCAEWRVRVGSLGRDVLLDVDGEWLHLQPVPAASGARFEAPGDPRTFYWSRGAGAQVAVRGRDLPTCVSAIPVAEAALRAAGNEPGWSATLGDGRLALALRYGEVRLAAPLPPPGADDSARRYRLEELDLELGLSAGPCRDSMSGMPYPLRAELRSAAGALGGCAGEPVTLLLGSPWRVERLREADVVDRSRPTLAFSAPDRLAGDAGCNRYAAPFALSGEGLVFGLAAATRRACIGALMEQESGMLQALSEVTRFDLDASGALLLHGGDDEVLIRARRD